MKILENYPGNDLIASATTDDGSITYSPIGNDRLIDNTTGRDMSRGRYLDLASGYETDQVPASIWDAAIALRREVDAHNTIVSDGIRDQAEQREIDRYQPWQLALAADMDRADSDK